MQQRCQLARVLATDPSLLLMDEPFGALDALTRERLQTELRHLWVEQRRTVVFVTHSVEEAVLLGTRVLVMSPRPGRVVLDLDLPFARTGATLPDLRTDPGVLAAAERLRAAIDHGGDTDPCPPDGRRRRRGSPLVDRGRSRRRPWGRPPALARRQ